MSHGIFLPTGPPEKVNRPGKGHLIGILVLGLDKEQVVGLKIVSCYLLVTVNPFQENGLCLFIRATHVSGSVSVC